MTNRGHKVRGLRPGGPVQRTRRTVAARVLGILLLIAAVGLAFPHSLPRARAHHQNHPCAQHWWEGVGERKQLLRCEERRIDPPRTYPEILDIAICESGPDLMDTDDSDGHGGPLQQAVEYWLGRYREFRRRWDVGLKPVVTNFRSNVVISLRMVKAMGDWSHWSCA